MELGKREDNLIKHHITRDVNTSFRDVKTLEPFVHVTITETSIAWVKTEVSWNYKGGGLANRHNQNTRRVK
jgi:hypothetical protein